MVLPLPLQVELLLKKRRRRRLLRRRRSLTRIWALVSSIKRISDSFGGIMWRNRDLAAVMVAERTFFFQIVIIAPVHSRLFLRGYELRSRDLEMSS